MPEMNHARIQTPPGTTSPDAAAISWFALTEDTAVSVLLLDADGTILFVNEQAMVEFNLPRDQVLGKNYASFFAPEFGEERLSFFQRVCESASTLLVEHTFNGQRRRTTLRPFPADASGSPRILMMCRPAMIHETPPPAGHQVIRARHNDLGTLASLTPREMEILCLIGQGLATADIAKHLHRSEKTVEWHRVSLGNKLGVSNRVELARIAIRSGLTGTNPDPRSPVAAAE
jgi:PAS domain S-box-containing protein